MSVLKITTFILLCIPINLYAGVYKWVDAKGNVTYSSKPPPTGAKQQKIETIRSLGSTPAPQRTYSQSNRNSAQQSYQSQNYSRQTYNQPQQPTRSAEDEALRQKIIQEASTPYKGARGLTANQRNTLAAMNGVNVSSGDSYSNSNNSYSAPMPQHQSSPTHMTSCDGSGCWDNQGNRYNGNNGTYYNNGRVCRDIGGQMQCN
ncbi:DUF4124 domain-containing protein [Acinetobacter bereziniae]|uniref:DUF4124 domain-containing protein n=1 Tax=Acinetobacter bereziniae TaxID=106648 RepID=UPI001D193FD4|nr:DUF4124 domain-containing protein [Acinetobacter bereziniae]